MIPVDCPREPGPLSLTHKRFKSGQFCMGTIVDVFLMAPITAEARGGISESPVKLEASSRACDYREQDCRALADALMALRQIPGYRDRAPASKRSEEHTAELQSLMTNSYAVFCLTKKNTK